MQQQTLSSHLVQEKVKNVSRTRAPYMYLDECETGVSRDTHVAMSRGRREKVHAFVGLIVQ